MIVTHPGWTVHQCLQDLGLSSGYSTCATADNVLPANSDKSYQYESHPTELLFPEEETLDSKGSPHSRTEPDLSFTGFDPYDEARRPPELEPNCPAFWPSQDAIFCPALKQHDPGVEDLLGCTHEESRTPSMDDMLLYMSMFMLVHHPFPVLNRNKPRKRFDSSSFYFRAPSRAQMIHPYRHGHRRGPSAISMALNARPVSSYNRSLAGHRQNDSNTSASSVVRSNTLGYVLLFDIEPPRLAKESPNKSQRMENRSITLMSYYQVDGARLIKGRQGLLEWRSLEDSALIASRNARAFTLQLACFHRTVAFEYMHLELFWCRDLTALGVRWVVHLGRGVARARRRARARGMGHRRRIEQARMSRSSVYETIEEEASVLSSSPSPKHPTPQSVAKQVASPLVNNSVYTVDGDSESIYSGWNEENGIMTLRHYYALCDEAYETVTESRRIWVDTPFSVFAVQSFPRPKEPAVMQAMLEHSQENSSQLRPHRVEGVALYLEEPTLCPFAAPSPEQPVLREVQRDANVYQLSPAPALDEIELFSPIHIELDTSKHGEGAFGLPSRPRVTWSTRRTALGRSKRSTGKSAQECKENLSARSIIPTPSETLRINRHRPRGLTTPARVPVPVA
ncbi:hypothetical protein GY45DRAFT_1376123 [Cubamyces sp. BRFM 1775]|nr:hypothetical protein GY45DRAFT_1376123 [Cubamyces sp. BRFM 1775]